MVTAVLAMPAVRASNIDLHWLWDDRCDACHGHAGDFARKFLSVSSGELQGPHHTTSTISVGFLHNHYLAGNEVDAVYNMLLAQANNQARFKNECASCHDTAAMFVRIRWSFAKVCSTAGILDARSVASLAIIWI